MDVKNTYNNPIPEHHSAGIIVWEERYDTKIPLIDKQHKMLANIINELHQACCNVRDVDSMFKEAMSRVVEYVRLHFATEQQILKQIKYPGYKEHIKEHESLVKDILESAKNFNEGKRFVPHQFVHMLKDWFLSHIAITDKQYVSYIIGQKRNGIDFGIMDKL